ncbi:hypothetical protein P8452_44972 [Trifolium repens]|nr:hypothetical protein P8452_44972 [Trifolium repens]
MTLQSSLFSNTSVLLHATTELLTHSTSSVPPQRRYKRHLVDTTHHFLHFNENRSHICHRAHQLKHDQNKLYADPN